MKFKSELVNEVILPFIFVFLGLMFFAFCLYGMIVMEDGLKSKPRTFSLIESPAIPFYYVGKYLGRIVYTVK